MPAKSAIVRGAATAVGALALLAPPATANVLGLKVPIPASARTQSTASTATTTAAPNGAQPGTVAPGASSAPTATTPPVGATGATGGATGATGVATGATGTTAVAPPSTTVPGQPATLGIVRRQQPKRTSKGLSGLALVLAGIGALLVLASLVWALTRWLALQPRWTSSLMYSLREASYHASATWAEFSDWARIGR